MNNFGVIRDVRTLELVRLAPLFDSGNSLWCGVPSLDVPRDYDYEQLPFRAYHKGAEDQLRLLSPADMGWLDLSRLPEVVEIVGEGLVDDPMVTGARVDAVTREVRRRAAALPSYARDRARSTGRPARAQTLIEATREGGRAEPGAKVTQKEGVPHVGRSPRR